MTFTVRQADWDADREPLMAVRREVFMEEQGISAELEWDGLDPDCRHFLALDAGGRAIGTARLLPDGHIGRVAVVRPWRGRGVGTALLRLAVATARTLGFVQVELAAQTHAIGFYQRLGFVAYGPEFPDAGIPHRHMRLHLSPPV